MQKYQISNGFIDLSVSPNHGGRILNISLHQNKNLLYIPENEDHSGWMNYGGDFLWIAPQERWGWPPIKAFDQDPWTFVENENGITLSSTNWEGLYLSRQINFSKIDMVVVTNTITNISNRMKWGLWNITQIPINFNEVSFITDINIKVFDYPQNITLENLIANKYISIKRTGNQQQIIIHPKKGLDFKIGCITKELKMQIDIDKFLLEKTFSKQKDMSTYPHGCNIEFYKNDDYLEAEILWPMIHLKSGESYSAEQYFRVIEK